MTTVSLSKVKRWFQRNWDWRRLLGLSTGSVLGLEISSSAVKLLEFSEQDGRYCVESYGVEPLGPQVVVDRTIKDVEAVTAAIQRLLARVKPRAKFAALSVSGSTVITRVLQLTKGLSEAEVKSQLEVEAEHYIPYPLDEGYWDFQVLGASDKHPELMDVILAVSKVDKVDGHMEAVNASGLQVKIVDVDTLALERAFGSVKGQLPDKGVGKTIAMIDIGDSITTLYVMENFKTIYTREQAFGGRQLTDEIQRRYGLTYEEALAAKKFGGLPDDYLAEVLEPFKENIVQQISRTLQFFLALKENSQVHLLILGGGTASIGGLEALVEEKISIKAIIANPFLEMDISKRINGPALFGEAPSLMVCCGLAMRDLSYDIY